MGLSEPRKRRKIERDPNNTAWTRSTSGFGHKILSAQGWKPGGSLGANDAQHAAHYTGASIVPISVLLKDDNLGLGAKSHKSPDEKFGLDIFQDVLGRLNGRSDAATDKAQRERAERKTRVYAAQKFGVSRFVRGGFLVGDENTSEGLNPEPQGPTTGSDQSHSSVVEGSRGYKEGHSQGLKGKISTLQSVNTELTSTDDTHSESTEGLKLKSQVKEEKRQRRAERKQRELEERSSAIATVHKRRSTSGKRDKASKKLRGDRRVAGLTTQVGLESAEVVLEHTATQSQLEDGFCLDIQAEANKEAEAKAEIIPMRTELQPRTSQEVSERSEHEADASKTQVDNNDTRQRAARRGRQAARHRYIQHKRLAFQDPKALREILMSR